MCTLRSPSGSWTFSPLPLLPELFFSPPSCPISLLWKKNRCHPCRFLRDSDVSLSLCALVQFSFDKWIQLQILLFRKTVWSKLLKIRSSSNGQALVQFLFPSLLAVLKTLVILKLDLLVAACWSLSLLLGVGKTLEILKLAAFPSGGISSLSIVGLAGRWSPSLPGGLERKTLVILKLVGLLLTGMFSPSIRGKAAKSLGSLVEIWLEVFGLQVKTNLNKNKLQLLQGTHTNP